MKRNLKKIDWMLSFALAATVLALVFPGDIPWLGDTAARMGVALDGQGYGLNRLWLPVTSDPVIIAGIGTALALLVCWGAVWMLSRIFHVPAGPGAALFFCSPFVWFALRSLQSGGWLLPLSLWLAVVAARMIQRSKGFLTIAVGVWLPLFPVLLFLVNGGFDEEAKGGGLVALTSFRFLTGWGFSDRFAPETGLSLSGTLLFLSVPMIVFFIVLGCITVVRRLRRGEAKAFDRTVGWCGIAAVVYVPLATWRQCSFWEPLLFAWLLLAWRGYTAFRGDYRILATVLLGFALLLEVWFLVDFSFTVHRYAGGSSPVFGTTLARQWRVARSLTAARKVNPELRIDLRVDQIKANPLPLQVLIRMAATEELPPAGFFREAVILPSRSGSGIDLLLMK